MEHKRRCAVLQIFPLFFMVIQCWHDLDNTEYDCWPMEHPNEYNMIDCAGLEMSWVIRPPEKVQSGEEFNVTYTVSASNDFYQMAVTNGILKYSNASEAKRFCEERECPINWKDATESNCCVYHANIHSCPLAFMKKGGICGPWIPDDGKIVTHTISQAGKMSQQNWTSKVVLIHVGVTSLIAHVKVGHMHAALEAKTTVISGQVCDDGVCDGGERCDTCPADCGVCPMAIGIKISIGLPIAVFGSGFILTLVWLQYQKQKMLWDESWIINLNEIKLGRGITAAAGSIITVQQASGNSVTSLMTDVTTNTCVASPSHKQQFIQKGIYDGQTVAIKRIPKKTFTLSKTVRKEVKQVRGTLIILHSIIHISDHPARLQGPDAWLNTVIQHSIIQTFDYPNKILPVRIIEVPLELDHPNLCKFIGGSVEVPNATIVTEYCPKGSLADVLFNDDIPLNWGFRLSFATDVARAMAYLHQHRIYHGRLHSMNCVIDDRWVCKVSDYGLAAYRKDDFEEFSPTLNERARRITCAPEVFTGLVSNVTPTSDVYSYSIILLEIATRCEPVSGDIDLDKVEPTWRPYLPEINAGKSNSDCPNQGDYTELIKRCWAHNPLMRPTFEQIKKMLEKMNPNKVSPVDKMMNLMEKYSKHLESIVAERTQDLLQEKQKTDSLLYSMLPKQVADDLRQGITSQAQSYSNATVFFSDIVGFTQLSSASTPYQVVDFLNRLYTCFDAIIDNYDVYKVETIGDAYMVVSGVPKENGIKHASEIASMALDLVAVCSSFIIPHKPDVKLKIRAGIHSGPVVAGVVGTKMPRYCLFGDTVNTASRMESTSEALKIQCSSSSSELLNETGGYILKCRGPLLVKGKGEMTTWWLEGKTCDGTQ